MLHMQLNQGLVDAREMFAVLPHTNTLTPQPETQSKSKQLSLDPELDPQSTRSNALVYSAARGIEIQFTGECVDHADVC
jgi:hypothetical protein